MLVLSIIALSIAQAFWYKNSYSSTAYVAGGTYTEATLGKINSINPLLASTNSEKTLSKLLYLGLTGTDYSGHTGNVLAESVSMNANGKIWTVKLRDGLKWSDGEDLTVEDILFTVELLKNTTVATSYSSNLSGVKVSESDGKIIFSLSTAYVDFNSALSFPILPEHIFANAGTINNFDFKNAAYSGPFTFKAMQNIKSDGEAIVYLSSNPYYYGENTLLSSFAVHAFMDVDSIVTALNSGSVTGTAELSPSDKNRISSASIYEKDTSLNSGVFIFMNTNSTILKNKTIRKAIQKGIDIEEMRSVAGDENALNYPILSSQADLSTWPELPSFDPESAKATISAAALEDPLEIATITTGYFPALAEDLSEQLESLGFKVNVTTYEPNQEFLVNTVATRDYDILLYEVSLGVDPDLFAYYHSSQATSSGLNLSNYSNTLTDSIILSARETTNETARNAKYSAFLRYWVNDAPAIAVYQTNLAYYFNKNTRNFSEDVSLVNPLDRFVDIEYWSVEKSEKNRTP